MEEKANEKLDEIVKEIVTKELDNFFQLERSRHLKALEILEKQTRTENHAKEQEPQKLVDQAKTKQPETAHSYQFDSVSSGASPKESMLTIIAKTESSTRRHHKSSIYPIDERLLDETAMSLRSRLYDYSSSTEDWSSLRPISVTVNLNSKLTPRSSLGRRLDELQRFKRRSGEPMSLTPLSAEPKSLRSRSVEPTRYRSSSRVTSRAQSSSDEDPWPESASLSLTECF